MLESGLFWLRIWTGHRVIQCMKCSNLLLEAKCVGLLLLFKKAGFMSHVLGNEMEVNVLNYANEECFHFSGMQPPQILSNRRVNQHGEK